MATNAPSPPESVAIPNRAAPVTSLRRTLASDPRAPAENLAGLKRVARQFEAIFLGALLKSMRATVPDSRLFGASGATRLYREWHDQELADLMASRGNAGIGALIVQQYGAQLEATEASPPPAPPHDPSLLARYRGSDTVAASCSRMAKLRHRAAALGGAAADTLGRYQQEIDHAAAASGLDPALVLAVVQAESAGDAAAVSPRGALGLMQLMPGTAVELGVNPLDAAANLRGGARYLAQMLRRYGGRLDLALAAYNAGPGAVDRAGPAIPPYAETRRYVERVTASFGRLGGDVARPWHESGETSR